MPTDDLKAYATSSTDFYELLGINFETSQRELDRAWRRTALKYHPDKVGPDATAKEKFQLAQIGYDLLSDPASKAIYDNARTARLQRQRQNDLFEGRRRQMKDDLEARERGVKRPRNEELGDEEKLEVELRRLAEDGKRRRKEREEALRKDLEKEKETARQSHERHSGSKNGSQKTQGVTEIDRTIKVRWAIDDVNKEMNIERLEGLFSIFGNIENTVALSPKMAKLKGEKRKRLVAICMITFTSVVGAHAAVEDFQNQQGPEWSILNSVTWAANKEPDFMTAHKNNGANHSTPSRPATVESLDDAAKAKLAESAARAPKNAPNGRPTFASFGSSTTSANTINGSTFLSGIGLSGPSLEEMTMIRLRKLEQKRLAAELQRQDDATDAAAKTAKDVSSH